MNRAYAYLITPVAAVGAVMAVLLGAGPAVVQASVTPTEHVVFSDDFDNNNNGWSNIGAASGEATISTDPGPTSASVVYPSVDSDGNDVPVSLTGPTGPLDISRAPISVYARVRVDDVNNGDANNFSFGLEEDGGFYGVNLAIRPGSAAQIYRRVVGINTPANLDPFTFPNTTDFVDFRLTLTDNGGGTMTAEAFYDTGSGFTLLGSVADAETTTGIFGSADQADPGLLNLYMRNNSGGSNRAYFDSIAITQIPEPSTMFLLVSGAACLWWYRRRGK